MDERTRKCAFQIKVVYLLGYIDAVTLVSMMTTNKSTNEPDAPAMLKLANRFCPTVGDFNVVEVLDAFYVKPENLRIGIAWALQLIAAKASGVAPAFGASEK